MQFYCTDETQIPHLLGKRSNKIKTNQGNQPVVNSTIFAL